LLAARAIAPIPCRSSIWRAMVWICISDVISLSQGSLAAAIPSRRNPSENG
jgi:hypothetical protein